MRTETDEIRDNLKYLTLLSRDYPSQAAAASEIISTQALLKLPKGTEHFMSDLHGENEAFVHILNSASGVIREKVDQEQVAHDMQLVHGQMLDQFAQPHDEAVCTAIFNNAAHDLTIV